MPPLIRDYVEHRKVEYLSSITPANLHECLRTFLPTDSLIELVNRILETICKKLADTEMSSQGPSSILLTGGHGVGKRHLLSVIYGLISQKGTLSPGLNDPRVLSNITTLREIEPLCIWIDLSDQTEVSLPELVLTKIHSECQKRFGKQMFDPNRIPGIDTIKAHELITFHIANEKPILLMFDGLSQRAPKRDVRQLNEDIEFLSFMGYSSKTTQLFLLVAAHEDFFSPKSPLGIDGTLMAQTLENFKIEWIDRANLREIIFRHVFRKNPRQQEDVRKLHAFIKAKLPNFHYSENEFCETYPFHPLIFDLAEKIKSKVPSFSLLDFVNSTYPKVASHRAISLVTIENLFDRLEYQIKTNPSCQRLYVLYMKMAEEAVPRLQDRYRLWGKMLLKATFLFTLADRTPSVRDLTDALLLFEDSEGLSYNVVGMLLGQMEKAVEGGFTSTDDRLDRTYRLGAADLREELEKYLSNVATQIPETDPRLCGLFPEMAAEIFPDWPLERDLSKSTLHTCCALKVYWRGTDRPGQILPSERFPGTHRNPLGEPLDVTIASQRLPAFQDSYQQDSSSVPLFSGDEKSEIEGKSEWLLWIEPIGLTPELQASIKPLKVTEGHWVPAEPSSEEMAQLKKALALRLTEKSASNDFALADLHSLRQELKSDLANLFRELYLNRGRIITCDRLQAFNQGHLECHTFRAFLSYLFKPNFNQLYSLHPDFGGEQLTENHVMKISRGLFAGQDPTNEEVQRLTGKFALPLGLVSLSDGLYELNLSITPPIFLTQVFQYLETLDATERPIQSIFALVRRSPFGLTLNSLHLILSALVADGQIELYDPETNTTISRENFALLEALQSFSSFKRIPTHKDYPVEVLTQWCRLITGRPELTDISTSRGREAAVSALNDWLRNWRHLGIPRRLDNLPNELLTTQMWRKLTWTKRRFENVTEFIELIPQKEISLIQGMGKIIDLFAENINLLEKASRDLVELSHFIDWMENFLSIRKYVLSSEKTENSEIDGKRETLLRLLESVHDLIQSEKRNEFDALFLDFKEQYIDFFATQHDQAVGPFGKFGLLNEVQGSIDFWNLQLLVALPLGDSSYLDCLDEWLAGIRDHQCSLPVRDVLQTVPSCQCSFRLSRPLDLGQVVEDLKSFIQLGVSQHRQVLEAHKHAIQTRLNHEDGTPVKNADIIHSLLGSGPLPQLNQEVIDQINSLLDHHLLEEKLVSPLPALIAKGRVSKKELQERIQAWLGSLSDQEDLVFTFRNF